MDYAGVVVLYNPSEEVKENILTYLSKIKRLYVIDNSENQNNEDKLPKSKKIKYINNHQNLGIAKALNIACQEAINEGFAWILTMDQDSKFHEDNLQKLMDFTENQNKNKVGIVSPYHLIATKIPKSKEEVDYPIEVMTSGNLLNLDAFQKIEGFKEWLFIDSVDTEYCMNLRVHGYEIIRLNKIELEHQLGDHKTYHILGHDVICSNHNYIRRYYITRNIYYVYEMYHDAFPDYCEYLIRILKFQARNILCLEKDKIRKLRNMLRGKRDYKKRVKGKYPYKD